MPKLTPFVVEISKDENIKQSKIVPLVEHPGGAGPNWTLAPDDSPGGNGTIKFSGKKEVETYFKRKNPESAGYTVELK